MAKLDEIIDGASDASVSTADLLRKAAAVAHRIEAAELSAWIRAELGGYDLDDDSLLPTYRGPFTVQVMGRYATYGLERPNVAVDSNGAPEELQGAFLVSLRQPVAQLEQMAASEHDSAIPWPSSFVALWNELEDKREVTGLEDWNLLQAQRIITRSLVAGVIDRVRSTLQSFALDLQTANPESGEVDGPTTADPVVGQTVTTIYNYVFGDGANIANAPSATQTSAVGVNDLGGFLSAVQALGISDRSAVADLAQAATASETERPSRLRAFIEKVEAGTYTLAAGVTTKVASEGLTLLANQFLGLK